LSLQPFEESLDAAPRFQGWLTAQCFFQSRRGHEAERLQFSRGLFADGKVRTAQIGD